MTTPKNSGALAALALTALWLITGQALAGPRYTVTDLGSLGTDANGRGYSYPTGLNAAGQVVGNSNVYDAAGQSLGNHAFLWQNGQMQDLGSLGTDAEGRSYNVKSFSYPMILLVIAICFLMPTVTFAQLSPGASVLTKVYVPEGMRSAPFDNDRYLKLPPDFSIAVYARIGGARFMAIAPNGDLLVSQPDTGKVLLVRSNGSGDPLMSTFVDGLRLPHDLVFHTIDGITYLYVAESHQINRFIYTSGNTTAHDRQVVVAGLPDSSTPELQGHYGHELKNIALDANHKLYVSIASTCNACVEDTLSDPIRGAIYQYNADGTDRRLFAQGLRNAEGLALVPGTQDLWVVVNNRDDIAYPHDDGSGNYGLVIPSYVDNHPPEEFTRVREGGNYGWPFCNPNPDTPKGLNKMPFDRDYQLNADGHVDCFKMNRIIKGIPAHSAPLGLSFLNGTRFPRLYRPGVVVALHGSWNRQQKIGYKVIYFPWKRETQRPGRRMTLVSGWLNKETQEVWGRPVDVAADLQGNLLISDDYSGTIYKLMPAP